MSGNMGGVMIKKYIIHMILISLLFISVSCGKGNGGVGNSDDAPDGSTITMYPQDGYVYDSLAGDVIVPISVYVKNKEGIPINDVELLISGSFAAPRNPARYQFYREVNGGDPVNSGFIAVTNENGVYEFSIKIYAIVGGSASAFLDNITVNAQSAFASIEISLGQ